MNTVAAGEEANQAVGVKIMRKVVSVEAMADHKLSLVFDDGTRGTISIADRLFGPRYPEQPHEGLLRHLASLVGSDTVRRLTAVPMRSLPARTMPSRGFSAP